MDSDLANFGSLFSDVLEEKEAEKTELKKEKKELVKEVVKAESEVKRVEGVFNGVGGSSGIIAALGAAWKVYHTFFSTEAKEKEEKNSYHIKLGEVSASIHSFIMRQTT